MSTVVRVAGPLRSATTYRRGAFLLLGGVLLLPYGIVGVGLARLARDRETPLLLDVVLIAATAVIGLAPPFLHGARVLEVAAARWLLGVDLPDPPDRPAREARLRGALWFAVHLAVGGVVGLVLFAAVPAAGVLIVEGCGAGPRRLDPWTTLRIWVEAPAALRLPRGLARDGEDLAAHWRRWQESEARHFAADDTRARAQLRVDGAVPCPDGVFLRTA